MRGFAVPFMAKTWAVVWLTVCVAMAQTNAPAQGANASQENAAQQTASQQNPPQQTSQQGTSQQSAARQNPAPTAVSASSASTPGNNQNAQSSKAADLDLNRNPADRALEKQVAEQFANKAEFQNVKISVNGGVVTLDGSVPTKIERRQAKALARGVNGVKKVQEHLTVTGAGVAGPGTFANTTTTAQNQPAANTGAPASTEAGSATAQASETTAGGGTSGVAMNTAPPSSNIGAGASITPPGRSPISRPNASQPSQNTFGLTTIDPASLASKINTALKNDPSLAKNNVMVNVSDQGVEVTGSVDTGKEKVTAMRIAQSYAGNFKVVDRLTLAGRAPAPNARQTPSPTQANSSTPPPPQNVVGNQVLPPNTARNTRDPKTAGDKSSNPR